MEAGIPGCNGGGGGGADGSIGDEFAPLPFVPVLPVPPFLLSGRRCFGLDGAVDRKEGDEEEEEDL